MKAIVQQQAQTRAAQADAERTQRHSAPYRAAVEFFQLDRGEARRPPATPAGQQHQAAIDFFRLDQR